MYNLLVKFLKFDIEEVKTCSYIRPLLYGLYLRSLLTASHRQLQKGDAEAFLLYFAQWYYKVFLPALLTPLNFVPQAVRAGNKFLTSKKSLGLNMFQVQDGLLLVLSFEQK